MSHPHIDDEFTDATVRELNRQLAECRAARDAALAEIRQLSTARDNAVARAGAAEAEQLVPLHYESNGETGDGQTVCDGCGAEREEPHTWKECLPIAIENIQGAEGQVNDYLSQEVTRLTEQLSATEAVVEAAKALAEALMQYEKTGNGRMVNNCQDNLIRAVDALAESQREPCIDRDMSIPADHRLIAESLCQKFSIGVDREGDGKVWFETNQRAVDAITERLDDAYRAGRNR